MIFIGDVHGKIDRYLEKLGDKPSLQIGDMGLGFEGVHLPSLASQHRFIRGNHDNPQTCRRHQNYAGDYGYDFAPKLFYLGGAYSVDKQWRVPGVSWWEQEEMSTRALRSALKTYSEARPEIVATHDCPESVSRYLLGTILIGFRPEKLVRTRTGQALQAMLEIHRPKVWVFGHYHIDKDFEMDGTRFICLNELSTIDLGS